MVTSLARPVVPSSSTTDLVLGHFPGARSENAAWLRGEMMELVDDWFRWRERRFEADIGAAGPVGMEVRHERLSERLRALRQALTDETPTFTPRYVAHMKADLSLPAILGWFAAMLHNPNTTSPEASRVGSVIEREAVAHLARMLGYRPETAQGHFTSGGTVANFEAAWRARYRLDLWLALALHLAEATGETLDPFDAAHMGWDRFRDLSRRHGVSGRDLEASNAVSANRADIERRISQASGRDYAGPVLLAPGSCHYSWNKAANLLGLGAEALWKIPLDARGRIEVDAFDDLVERAQEAGRPILMSVAVAGATETGAVDPLDRLYARMDRWRREHGWWIWRHVDAAYGGFFCALRGAPAPQVLTPETAQALDAVSGSDSVTIDPHKLGFVPYACGAFLTPDAQTYAVSAFDAPYLDRPELGAGKWASTLEGSRSASGASATWLTAETLGFDAAGLGAVLAETIRARQALQATVEAVLPQVRFLPSETNLACFSLVQAGEPLSVSNARTQAVFERFQASPSFSVSRTTLGASNAALKAAHLATYSGHDDESAMVVIRLVVMNPYWCDAPIRARMINLFVQELQTAIEAVEQAPHKDRNS